MFRLTKSVVSFSSSTWRAAHSVFVISPFLIGVICCRYGFLLSVVSVDISSIWARGY